MKTQKDLIGLSRMPVANQLHALIQKPPKYDMHGLVRENILTWFFRNLWNLGNCRTSYQKYQKPDENNGIFKISGNSDREVTIALLSDWASDTSESHNIGHLVGEKDFSIHLGDTYYVGNFKEIADNFNSSLGAPWPYGKEGSFALLGNHEMYSSGRSYFRQLLPYMGIYLGKAKQQEASYFCLENNYWRIIGLDTGYDSLKGIFGLSDKLDLKLHPWQMEWLKNTVRLNDDNRGIIFLCHHQYFSAFENEYTEFAKQVSSLIGANREIIWFWGHEHRMAVYGRNHIPDGFSFFARCIGNGGMPVELGKTPKSTQPNDEKNRNLVIYDDRERNQLNNKIRLGYNGYVLLKLNAEKLIIEYYDDNSVDEKNILIENWSVDLNSGKLSGINIIDNTITRSKKLTLVSTSIKNAIN